LSVHDEALAGNTGKGDFARERRLTSLDAVRGLAACVVLISHIYHLIPYDQRTEFENSFWSRVLLPMYNGEGAVFIFFVLSGYVLSLPFFRGSQLTYGRYVVRRVCRIYIPFVVAVFLALLFYRLAGRPNAPAASWWFNNLWPAERPGLAVIAGHFLMNGTKPDIQLNQAIWSLVYEMRISLLFPLLVLLSRDTRIAIFGCFVLWTLSGKGLSCDQCESPVQAENLGVTALWTFNIIPYFVTGILLSKHREQIHRRYERLSSAAVFALFALAALPFMIKAHFEPRYALGAAILVILAIENKTFRSFLDLPIPQWLGRISYSVYLIHLPLMLAVAPLLLSRMPFVIAASALLCLSLGAGWGMQALVEAPAIGLGHRLTRRRRGVAQNAHGNPVAELVSDPTN
jgi:peptidoglycan/LPS O-acetylase OafA/YrhL